MRLVTVGLPGLLRAVLGVDAAGRGASDARERQHRLQMPLRREDQTDEQPVAVEHALDHAVDLAALVLLDQRLGVRHLVDGLDAALVRAGPDALALALRLRLECPQPLEQGEGLVGLVAAPAGLVADARPPFLHAELGQGGVAAGEADDAVLALDAGGDGVEDLEVDDLADEELAEEFTGGKGIWLL